MVTSDPDILPAPIRALAGHGARIGLLGGSFNPAHDAHFHISQIALRRLRLDAVWWLVSPQNPLKPSAGMAPLAKRLERARQVARHPRFFVSAVEEGLQTRYSIDTILALQHLFSQARFVWLMGGDSLAEFHKWRHWQDIFLNIPIAVIARPGFTVRALNSPAAERFRPARVADPDRLCDKAAPAWSFLLEALSPTSATAIRRQGNWL